MAEELKARLDSLRDISLTEIIGGYRRQIRIEPHIENLIARKISLSQIKTALAQNSIVATVGKTFFLGSGNGSTYYSRTGKRGTSPQDSH